MSEDYKPEDGFMALMAKTFMVLYTGFIAFTTTRVDAGVLNGHPAPALDGSWAERLRATKRKPQLVLKLNVADPSLSRAMMHTSHRSHSSHSSHASHSSHSSHSSHYSSSTYTPSSGSTYTPSSTPSPTYTPPAPSSSPTTPPSYGTGSYATPSLPTYVLGERVLKLGDRGSDVTALQQLLIQQGYPGVKATGTFDLVTQAAIKLFQVSKGLPEDGVAGGRTILLLRSGN